MNYTFIRGTNRIPTSVIRPTTKSPTSGLYLGDKTINVGERTLGWLLLALYEQV